MRDGDAEADSRTQHGLPLLHGGEDLVEIAAGAGHEVPRELRENAVLIRSDKGNHDPVRREQLGQEHGSASKGMGQT